jgi:hypothetical protein
MAFRPAQQTITAPVNKEPPEQCEAIVSNAKAAAPVILSQAWRDLDQGPPRNLGHFNSDGKYVAALVAGGHAGACPGTGAPSQAPPAAMDGIPLVPVPLSLLEDLLRFAWNGAFYAHPTIRRLELLMRNAAADANPAAVPSGPLAIRLLPALTDSQLSAAAAHQLAEMESTNTPAHTGKPRPEACETGKEALLSKADDPNKVNFRELL